MANDLINHSDVTKEVVAMPGSEKDSYRNLGCLKLSGQLAEYLNGEDDATMPAWTCWLSTESPTIASTDPEDGRVLYAPWLNHFKEKGLYIWLQPRPGHTDKYRFVHVGIASTGGKGGSTLATRTKVHCKNQLNGTDRIHRLVKGCGEFGSLGENWRGRTGWEGPAKEFLHKLRILFICAGNINKTCPAAGRQIRRLEGLIAYTGLEAFGGCKDEITNTVGKTTPAQEGLIHACRAAINDILEIFPDHQKDGCDLREQ